MANERRGEVAVIFISKHTEHDDTGYEEAATAMVSLAAQLPGYRGIESVRDATRRGITVSYWADMTSAVAWRDHAEHVRIRTLGRERWYESFDVVVTEVTRNYTWQRH